MPFQVRRLVDKFARYGPREVNDLKALHALAPLASHSYEPWSTFAMRPAGLVSVLNDIVVNGRTSVVECGAGLSTFYVARVMRDRGGHLRSLEHDAGWAKFVGAQLVREGLSDHATVIHAPLSPVSYGWDPGRWLWYTEDTVADVVSGATIDLLVVDGPPAASPGLAHARYPAVSILRPVLAKDYTIVLDDIHRRGEQEIVARWEQELGITFHRRFSRGRVAIGRSCESFTV